MFSETISVTAMLLTGVLVGLFVCSAMIEHAMRRLSAPHWIGYKQAKEAVFGPVMPVLFGIVLLLSITAAVATPTLRAGAAACIMTAILVITLKVHVPLNSRIQTWNGTEYAVTWDNDRRRWRDWNVARTLLVVLAWGLMVTAKH